jgi:hypothetical protein
MSSNSFVGWPVYRAAGRLFDLVPSAMARSVAFPVVTMTSSADFVDPLLLVLLGFLLPFLLFLLEVILVENRFVSPLRFVKERLAARFCDSLSLEIPSTMRSALVSKGLLIVGFAAIVHLLLSLLFASVSIFLVRMTSILGSFFALRVMS